MLGFDNLTVARGDDVLMSGLTLDLAAGGILLLTGPNGAGKTSLLRAAAGLLRPAVGTIRRADFHFLSAAPVPPSLETPREYLAFHAALTPTLSRKREREGPTKWEGEGYSFNIKEILDTPLNRLSTGQRQRVKLSRLLSGDKPLWLLDEPSDGLDAKGVAALQNLIAAHTAKGGAALIATHQPALWPDARVLHVGGAA